MFIRAGYGEYFGEDSNASWANGLRKNWSWIGLNGFIGKTSIHPLSAPDYIYESIEGGLAMITRSLEYIRLETRELCCCKELQRLKNE